MFTRAGWVSLWSNGGKNGQASRRTRLPKVGQSVTASQAPAAATAGPQMPPTSTSPCISAPDPAEFAILPSLLNPPFTGAAFDG